MSLMLPAEPAGARSLTDVLAAMSDSVRGAGGGLPAVRSAIVVVVDGLGAGNLDARAGHARFLASARGRKDVAVSTFPTTTATALTGLTTGVPAGSHGIVGYRALVPGTGIVANQLTGWEEEGLDPLTWQRSPTLFERRAPLPSFAVSKPQYADSGFTRATLRGAVFLGAASIAERLETAAATARAHEGALVYAYVPELDALGHRFGWESERWTATLETLDAAVRDLARSLDGRTGAIVTADHGMVDVPRRSHVLVDGDSPLAEGLARIGGEPRMLHLYADPGAAPALRERWARSEGDRAWVLSRDEAIEAGLFGEVADEVRPRIGDVLVAARARVAYYDDRAQDKAAQRMVGQHGSLTALERLVPLIRLGAYAR